MSRLPRGIIRKKGRPGYYVRDQRGGKDRLVRAGTTVEEAKKVLAGVRGETVPVERLTVGEAGARWLKRVVPLTRNAKGVKIATARVGLYLSEHLGLRPLRLLTADDCRGYRFALERMELAPQTVAHVLSDLRCLLFWAEGEGYIGRSPFPRRLLPRIQERAPDRLTDEEAGKLAALPEPWGFVLRLLLGTGLRWAEACRAQASHVERGLLVVAHTKSGKVRRIPLPPDLLAEMRTRVGRLVPYSEMQPGSFSRRIRNKSGVAHFHAHMTRHTFACRWLEHGGSITALQEIMGHASVMTTQRYGRPNEAAIRREAERSWG